MDFLKQSSKQLFWIQSELWLDHFDLFYSSQVLLCTLCRWKMNLQPKHRFLADWNRFSLIYPHSLDAKNFPVAPDEYQSKMLLPLYLLERMDATRVLDCTIRLMSAIFDQTYIFFSFLQNVSCFATCLQHIILSKIGFLVLPTLPKKAESEKCWTHWCLDSSSYFSPRSSVSVVAGHLVSSLTIAPIALLLNFVGQPDLSSVWIVPCVFHFITMDIVVL